jgi:putative hydrolase of the HAD superfamily
MKRIIFDVDDTLIMWKNEYWQVIENTFKKLNLDYSDALADKIKEAISLYRKEYSNFTKDKLLLFMNKYTSQEFTIDFINILLDEISNCADRSTNEIIDTLEYLKSKYDLVILSDWFTFMQERRLKKAGILKYFSKIYGPASIPLKPNPKSFLIACEDYDVTECIMIGDHLIYDIEGAKKVGMNAIYYNYKNNKVDTDIVSITKISDLKSLL